MLEKNLQKHQLYLTCQLENYLEQWDKWNYDGLPSCNSGRREAQDKLESYDQENHN